MQMRGGLLDTTEKYLAVVVTLLFVVGICFLIAMVREQKRTRKRWGGRG
jgi:hypothetical protein